MKHLLLSIIAITFCALDAIGQKEIPQFDTHHKNVTVELLGSHILVGANFDMRLRKGQLDGPGFRAGVGGLRADLGDFQNDFDLGLVTFPLEFNYVTGKRRSGFVTGVGLLPIYATLDGSGDLSDYEYVRGEGFGIVGGFLTAGYRLQPLRNGFTLQFNWNPLILRGEGFVPGWFGLSLGVGFK